MHRRIVATLVGLLCGITQAETRSVQFVVTTLDPPDAQAEQIFMPNSADGWISPGRTLRRVGPGVYVAAFEFERGIALEFKFTREPGWASVEKDARGSELPNRTIYIQGETRELVAICQIEDWADRDAPKTRSYVSSKAATQPATRASTMTGDVRRHQVESPQLGNTRTVIVWLPPGYEASKTQRYPVLYMHDGQNVFDAATSFLGVEWRADETAAQLIRDQKIEPLIIVGIYNTPARTAEYTPFSDAVHNEGGNGDAYLAFLVETVKPLIDKTYRTKPDREDTALAGSSLGGVISIYAICKHPDVFGKAGVISPALWFGECAALKYAQEHPPRADARIWVDVGTEEGEKKSAYVSQARELVELLEAKNLKRGVNVEYLEVEGAVHHEKAWAERFDRALMFLFPAKK